MNSGLTIERRIAKSYNEKYFKELNPFQKEILLKMYPQIQEKDLIKCKGYYFSKAKPDIQFIVNDEIKYVSIKSGRSDGMHIEEIKTFILFLRSLGVSIKTQKILLLYHYGDGTLNGTGKTRMLHNEIAFKYKELIEYATEELKTPEIIIPCLNRFMFTGTNLKRKSVDFIYFGDETYGILCSKNDLTNFVISRNYSHLKTMHIGPMTIQPYLRDVNRVSEHEYKRDMVQIKWHYLLTDLQKANTMKYLICKNLIQNPYYDYFKE